MHTGRMSDTHDAGAGGSGDESGGGSRPLLPEEEAVGSEDPEGQTEAILEESEIRKNDRSAAPSTVLEQRTSEDVTETPD